VIGPIERLLLRAVPPLGRSLRRRRLNRQARTRPLRVVVGAAGRAPPGWIETDRDLLDLLVPADWRAFFAEGSVDAIVAEHVLEHLDPVDVETAARTVFTFLRPGGRFRVAVPDGCHPDPAYREAVRPGGSGPGALDHRALWSLPTLSDALAAAGFRVLPLEWFDAAGAFHRAPFRQEDGPIMRCADRDPRNADGVLRYTSLVVDAVKP
jgi:predicted SAM-dependent methyltransferase